MTKKSIFAALLAIAALPVFAADPIELPAPAKKGGAPFMDVVTARKTTREFQPEALEPQVLSDLLYCMVGISHDGKLTIPTALDKQDIVVYLLLKEGAFRYDNKKHALIKIADTDLRKYATARPGMGEAGSASFVIVGDNSKWDKPTPYTYAHAGAAMQNLYLACADKKLPTVVCGSFVDEPLRKGLKLPAAEQIILVQIVGKPVK